MSVFQKNHRQQKYRTNIYRIQTNNLVMCGYFHIGFIDFMLIKLGIASSVIGLKICTITAGIKKSTYKKKKYDKIVLLAKS